MQSSTAGRRVRLGFLLAGWCLGHVSPTRAHQEALARRVPLLLEQAAASASQAPYAFEIWIEIARVQHRVGNADGARQALLQAKSAKGGSDMPYVRGMVPSGFPGLEGPPRLRIIADMQTAWGDIAAAKQSAREMGDTWLGDTQVDTLLAIVDAQTASGDVPGARATFAEALQVLAEGTKKRQIQGDAQRAEERKRYGLLGPGEPGVYEDSFLLRVIAEMEAKAGDIARAKQTARSIQNVGDHSLALSRIADVQGKKGDAAGAKGTRAEARAFLLREKRATDTALDKYDKDHVRDPLGWAYVKREGKVDALRLLALAQAKIGDPADAKRTLDEAKKIVPTVPNASSRFATLTALARAQWTVGDKRGATKTLAEAKRGICNTFDGTVRLDSVVTALGSVAGVQAEWKDRAASHATFAEMAQALSQVSHPRVKDALMHDMGQMQLDAGDSAGAQQTALRVRARDKRAYLLRNVACEQIKVGDLAGAQQTIRLMPEGDARDTARSDLAWAQGEKGLLVEARQTVGTIQSAGQKLYDLSTLAGAQARKGNLDEARQTLSQITDATSVSRARRDIAWAQVEAGDFAGAETTIAPITDPDSKGRALVHLASTLLDAAQKASKGTAVFP